MSIPPHAPVDNPEDAWLPARRPTLDAVFAPRSVALIGASESPGSVGRRMLHNLVTHPFGGTVYPVNLKRNSILGIRGYPTVAEVPEPVDLAIIATPAETVPVVMQGCVAAGVQAALIVSAGFKEVGPEGKALEREILDIARRGSMRVLGPNSLGIMRPVRGLNATFARTMARSGSVAFISQSGALLSAVLDWSHRENVGFSTLVSIGSMVDIGWGDLIDYLGNDPRTHSILLYMESVDDARSLLSATREVALQKPIIVIKAGRTEPAARAASSHTGALVGSDDVLSAAFRRTGVLRVNSIADLFYMAEVLAKQPRPRGRRLTILTNAGGTGVLATDTLIAGGGVLAPLSEATLQAFDALLLPHWSHDNPIDVVGDTQPEQFAEAVRIAAAEENTDGLLITLAPLGTADPKAIAEKMAPYARSTPKPVLVSWMGGEEVAAAEGVLNAAGIPTFAFPDTAARVFNYMWRYSYNLRGLYETPLLPEDVAGIPDRTTARRVLALAREAGRTLLSEVESKELLQAYGIPVVETRTATDAEEAVTEAAAIGYPVVLKVQARGITHKSVAGGVRLNLQTPLAVRNAFEEIRENLALHDTEAAFEGVTVQPMVRAPGYELILGSTLDPQFGPVLLFGSGGGMVEVYQDQALGLPPLTTTLARRMMEQTRIHKALQGGQGRPSVDLDELAQLMVRFSQLVIEQRLVHEVDVNPLWVGAGGLLALDARVVIHAPDVQVADLPKTAIRPYPRRYVGGWTMRNGEAVTIRPIRPEDEPLLVAFHETLSDRSVYLRYAGQLQFGQRVAHDRLARLCFIDYDREMALVAERLAPQTEEPEIIGVVRLTRLPGAEEAEFGLLVSDDYQRQGIGTELLQRIIEVGRNESLQRITAYILWQNRGMLALCRKLGFNVQRTDPADPMVYAVLELEGEE